MAKPFTDKLNTFRKIITENGGLKNAYLTLYRTEELKTGDRIGTDNFGNEYYQNKTYFMGRSRWVKYSDRYGMDYDGSQIPPEWHRWLQYISDEAPVNVIPSKKWQMAHEENASGDPARLYVPYRTSKIKVTPWNPPPPPPPDIVDPKARFY